MVIVWDELPTQCCGYWKLEIKLRMQMYFGEISRYLVAKTWIANILRGIDFWKFCRSTEDIVAIRFSEHLIDSQSLSTHTIICICVWITYLVDEDSGNYSPNTPEYLDLAALVESGVGQEVQNQQVDDEVSWCNMHLCHTDVPKEWDCIMKLHLLFC